MKRFCIIAIMPVFFTLFAGPPAKAAEYLVTQKDLKFNPIIKVVEPGDSINFSNIDNVVHNIVSMTEGFKFDLGEFKPGMTKSVQFKEHGVVDVECTVHPKMKMTIFIF